MKIKGNSYFLIFIMAITLFVIAWSLLAMEYYESKLLPVIIGSAVFILAAVLLRRDISAKGESEATPDGDGEGTDKPVEPLSGYLRQGAWVGGFVLAVYLLGLS